MRIRTIKPEFWSHPVMSRLDDTTRLLAIGLLNYADDQGYFFADAALVRSALRPFDEDSSIVRRSLVQLSIAGWIDIREHPTHGPIGVVCTFAAHQRVDRPKSSSIKDYYESTNDRRSIDERSTLEQGTGNREQGTGKREHARARASEPEPHFDDPFGPSDLDPRPVTDEDRWRMEIQAQEWASEIKRAGGKIGPKNWTAWENLVQTYGQQPVERAIGRTPPPDRWPDAVEQTMIRTDQEAVARAGGEDVVIL